jgi:arginine decarboxylase
MSNKQLRTPIFDAVKKYVSDEVISFHVPAHKQGKGLNEYAEFLGDTVLKIDANGMPDLDNACNPVGVIREAEKLCAQVFGAQNSYFLVNGTTAGVQAMILATCGTGDEIILPRNVHKSTFGALILSGAIPVYVQPEIDADFGIANNIEVSSLKECIGNHPHAKAVFILNPTYYGMTSDLKAIVRHAHRNNMVVLVDEAHGGHMSFHSKLPLTAMEVGADMSAVSLHKTIGSMTQTAALLTRGNIIDPDNVKQVINLTYTTSASYVLMCSIDIARKQMAFYGESMLEKTLDLVKHAKENINKIEGLYSLDKNKKGQLGCYDFDETKLVINVSKTGLTGYEVEKILRETYNIQIELSDMYNILSIVGLGETELNMHRLVDALKEIAKETPHKKQRKIKFIPSNPQVIVSPRDAFYSYKKSVTISNSIGEIAGEMIMAYPPGIPVVCPGERISKDIIDYVKELKDENVQLQGTADPYVDHIRILGN